MIAISIIAILSVTAYSVYSTTQRNGRDSKRMLEVNSIVKALEIKRTNSGYQPLVTSDFEKNLFPGDSSTNAIDPVGYPYCITTDSNVGDPDVSEWSKTACPTGYEKVSSTTPTDGSTYFKACALLENSNTKIHCKRSLR
ncbi:hypothetical protein HYS93_02240 [Candidatus Daviesbacteria bacterium]|nr:hypothetical protein [Candidatus Daviesbacteria bacterium]